MKTGLKIYTSFVSPMTLKMVISNNLLPVFILRSIHNSELIGKWSGSAVHLPELSPSVELFRAKRDGLIGKEEFDKKYVIEISRINLVKTLKTLETLVKVSGAAGVVLMGYGSDKDLCHRGTLINIFNDSGFLWNPVKEIVV